MGKAIKQLWGFPTIAFQSISGKVMAPYLPSKAALEFVLNQDPRRLFGTLLLTIPLPPRTRPQDLVFQHIRLPVRFYDVPPPLRTQEAREFLLSLVGEEKGYSAQMHQASARLERNWHPILGARLELNVMQPLRRRL